MNLKKYCAHTGIYFTVATVLYLVIWMLIPGQTGGVHPWTLLCLLPFCALFALANLNYVHSESLLRWRVLLHFLLTVGGAFVFLYLPNRTEGSSPAQPIICLLLFAVIYWIIMGIVLGVRARAERVKRDNSHYSSLYRNRDQGKAKDKEVKNDKKNKDDYKSVFKKK